MANVVYDSFFDKIMDGSIDLDTDTIKCALLTNAYTPAVGHDFFDDVSGDEAAGTGYSAGGETLANITVTGKVFDADDVSWAASTITAAYAVLYKDTGNPATSELIAVFDLGGDKSTTAGTFTVEWHSAGILTFSQSS